MNNTMKNITKANKKLVKNISKTENKNPNAAVAVDDATDMATAGFAAVVDRKITKIMWRRAFMKKPLPINTTTNPTATTPTTNPTTTTPAENQQQAPVADDQQQQ